MILVGFFLFGCCGWGAPLSIAANDFPSSSSIQQGNELDCFEHIAQETTTSYSIGDVWQICIKADPNINDGALDATVTRQSHFKSTYIPETASVDHHRNLQTTSVDIIVTVNQATDSPANSSSCKVPSSEYECNLRSAIDVCAQSLHHVDSNCTIFIPPFATLSIDASLGELTLSDIAGTFRLDGQGSNISSSFSPGHSIRFMNLTAGSVSEAGSIVVSSPPFAFYMTNVTLNGFGDAELEGGSLYLDGLSGGQVQDVTISNSRGSYGAAVYLHKSQYVQFIGCNFFDGVATGDGGAIYLDTDNVYISMVDCTFAFNTAQGLIDVFDALGGGVALNLRNLHVTFRACSFLKNTGARGGGLGLLDANLFTHLYNCVFDSNEVTVNGGAIYLIFDNSDFLVQECYFRDNVAEYGGAIRFWTGHYNVRLVSCTFSGNYAIVAGGGIHVYGNNWYMVIANCTFGDNSCSDFGGAIAVNSGNYHLQLINSTFEDNNAYNYGGGIAFLSDNRFVLVSDCVFVGNVAGLAGGGYYSLVLNTFTKMLRTHYTMNSAELYGGGLYFGSDHSEMIFDEVDMSGNEAESGAGVFISGFNRKFDFENCEIQNNMADNLGGGVYCLGQEVVFSNCLVMNNTAEIAGGIYYKSGSERLSQKSSVTNTSFISNTGHSSTGAMAIELFEHVNIQNCIFQGNVGGVDNGGLEISRSHLINITNCKFVDNFCASKGGGLVLESCSDVITTNTSFFSNIALNGGALFMTDCQDIEFTLCDVDNNTAGFYGGGFYVNGSSNVLIDSSSFTHNRVVIWGGSAVWSSLTEPFEIQRNYFAHNKAAGGGTVFYKHSYDMEEPRGLTSGGNRFEASNTALFGKYWATQGRSLSTTSTVINVTVYGQAATTLTVRLLDYYGQQVLIEDDSTTLLVFLRVLSGTTCDGMDGYLTGDIAQTFYMGEVIFHHFQAVCAPGHQLDLSFVSGNRLISRLPINMDFRQCQIGEFYVDRICTPCRNGTFSVTDPTDLPLSAIREVNVCRECPVGVHHCFANTLSLEPGFWRIGSEAVEVLRCPMRGNGCVGGSAVGADLCAKGYEGPLCAVCSQGYHRTASGTSCESCDNNSSWFDSFLVTSLVLFVLFAGVLVFFVHKVIVRKEKIEKMDDFFGLCLVRLGIIKLDKFKANQTKIRLKIQTIRRRFIARLKIYISFFQILSVLSYVLDFSFPEVYNYIINAFRSFVNLSISGSTVVNCSVENRFDFVDKLLFDTMYPLVVVVTIVSAGYIHLRRIQGCCDRERLTKVRANYTFACLVFLYMTLPFTSSTIFQTFSCRNVDPDDVDDVGDDMYMVADYSVSCESTRYHFAYIYALCALVVYPVGVPVLYFRLLYHFKDDISSRFSPLPNPAAEVERLVRIRPFIFLFDNYKSDYWFWEVIETSYRLALTGLLVLVAQGSSLQIIVGFCFAVFFFLCYEYFKPFHDPELQKLQHISLFQVSSIFFIALIIKAEFVEKNNILVNILIVVVVFLNLIIDFVSIMWGRYCAPVLFPMHERATSMGGRSTIVGGDGLQAEKFTEEHDVSSEETGGHGHGSSNDVVMSVMHNNNNSSSNNNSHDPFHDEVSGDSGQCPELSSEEDNIFSHYADEYPRGSYVVEMSPKTRAVVR